MTGPFLRFWAQGGQCRKSACIGRSCTLPNCDGGTLSSIRNHSSDIQSFHHMRLSLNCEIAIKWWNMEKIQIKTSLCSDGPEKDSNSNSKNSKNLKFWKRWKNKKEHKPPHHQTHHKWASFFKFKDAECKNKNKKSTKHRVTKPITNGLHFSNLKMPSAKILWRRMKRHHMKNKAGTKQTGSHCWH